MSDIHIDDFYRDAAKILIALYGQFPRKITLYVEDICGPDTPDEFGLHSPRHQACFHTMMWLGSADYLQYEQAVRQEALDQVVLSHRGFLLLNSVPASGNGQPSPASEAANKEGGSLIIHRIRQELRDGTSYSLADTMREIMLQSRRLGDIPKFI